MSTRKLQSSLQQLQDEIALLTAYSGDTIYRLRYETMQYDYISPAVERLLGYMPEEIEAMNFRDLILETRLVGEALQTVQSFVPYEDSRRRGEVDKWQADYLMRAKDGHTLWVADVSYPWFDEKGAIVGSIGSLRDITDRVEAEAQVRAQIERMASTDELTGLSNRRQFLVRLDDEIKRMKRSGEALSLLLIDIDHFKKVNNDFGQKIGDLVIQEVVRLIGTCLRETDMAARIGGEEFGVLLPGTPIGGAGWVAERIRAAVATHIFRFGDEHLMGCTVSIGVAAALPDEPVDGNTLYAAADRRLFIAKRTGRNQVSLDEVVEAG